jgi:hypothetical protein
VIHLQSGELTVTITALANALNKKFTAQELSLLAAIFTQLGDTLATISAQRSLCEEKTG